MKTKLLHLLVSIVVLGACSDPPPSRYPTQQVHQEDTTLGPGDVFEVRVFQQEDMTALYAVSSLGTISFPHIGTVKAAGRTPAQIEKEIRTRLAAGYFLNPHVSVLVKEYRSKRLSVFGQVRKAGTFGFAEGMTIVDAIAQAGGFSDMARKNAVTVTRKVKDSKKQYTVPVQSIGRGKARNFMLRPGDIVFVPRRVW